MSVIKHPFTSGKEDGADATLVKPSNWNDEHDVVWADAGELTANVFGGAASAGSSTASIPHPDHRHETPAIPSLATGRLFLTAAGGYPSVTAGCAQAAKFESTVYGVSFYALDFDATTAESAQWSVAMPGDWDASTVTAVFYWTHGATTTNFGVAWSLAGVSFGDGDAGDAAFGTAQVVVDTGGTTGDIYISDATAAITFGGPPVASELVVFKVGRAPANGGDTLAIDAKLLGVALTYGRV